MRGEAKRAKESQRKRGNDRASWARVILTDCLLDTQHQMTNRDEEVIIINLTLSRPLGLECHPKSAMLGPVNRVPEGFLKKMFVAHHLHVT